MTGDARLGQVEWVECSLEPVPDAELEREYRRAFGAVPPGIEYYTPSRWIARAFLTVRFTDTLVDTDFDLAELLWLAVSQDNSCRYCYAAHRTFLRILGYSERTMRRLEHNFFTAELDTRSRVALEFARQVSRSSPIPSSKEWLVLERAGFEEAAIKELAVVAAYVVFANRVVTIPALPLAKAERILRFPDRWSVRLMRPLMARVVRSKRRRAKPAHLTEALTKGPFSYLILALDGLPLAASLRRLIDDAWASNGLTPRTRLLIFAVVARGLAASRAEREATTLLAGEGFGDGELQEVLAHLTSPGLDDVERAIVSFARETIRYEVAEIQRQSNALRKQLDVQRLREVIGTAALANMVCRLETVVR